MGYQAPIAFDGSAEERWVGEHRPELVDLVEIFRRVVALDVAQLEVGPAAVNEAWRAVLPEDVHLIRALSPRAVHVHAMRGALVKDFVLKVSLPKPERGWRRLTSRVERSRSHRAHLWAHRLRALGIETPRPLGFVERAERPARYASFSATEFVQAPALVGASDLGVLGVGRTGAALQEKRALIVRVAELLRAMHANGVFHGDLHPGNLLVAGREVLVVDLESMRTFALPERERMKALVKLNRSFLDTRAVTRTDRMRFLLAYLRHDADRVARTRDVWRAVLRETERKLAAAGLAFR